MRKIWFSLMLLFAISSFSFSQPKMYIGLNPLSPSVQIGVDLNNKIELELGVRTSWEYYQKYYTNYSPVKNIIDYSNIPNISGNILIRYKYYELKYSNLFIGLSINGIYYYRYTNSIIENDINDHSIWNVNWSIGPEVLTGMNYNLNERISIYLQTGITALYTQMIDNTNTGINNGFLYSIQNPHMDIGIKLLVE